MNTAARGTDAETLVSGRPNFLQVADPVQGMGPAFSPVKKRRNWDQPSSRSWPGQDRKVP